MTAKAGSTVVWTKKDDIRTPSPVTTRYFSSLVLDTNQTFQFTFTGVGKSAHFLQAAPVYDRFITVE